MALWEFRVVYQNGDRFWENVWHFDVGADDPPSLDLVSALEDFGLNTLLSIYSLAPIAYRPAGTTNAFIDHIVDAAGLLPIGSNVAMPLFNVIRVLLEGTSGRPGIKMLRGALVVADVIDNQNHISTSLHNVIETAAVTLFNAVNDLGYHVVINAGGRQAFTPTTENVVAMRQLHRKRKKALV